MSGGNVKRKAEKPDWLDVLVSVWITAWVTLATAQAVLGLGWLIWAGADDRLSRLFFVTPAFAFSSFFPGMFVTSVVGVAALLLALPLSKRWRAALRGAVAGLIAAPLLALPALPALRSSADVVVLWVVAFVLAGGLAGLTARRTMLRRASEA